MCACKYGCLTNWQRKDGLLTLPGGMINNEGQVKQQMELICGSEKSEAIWWTGEEWQKFREFFSYVWGALGEYVVNVLLKLLETNTRFYITHPAAM